MTNRAEEVKLALHYVEKYKQGNMQLKDFKTALQLKFFRLCVFYYIKDKDGQKVRFTPNDAQIEYYINGHQNDIILKARQLGFTTFKMIHDLDTCLFVKNFSAGCIAHSDKDSKEIYRNKIRFAYRNIPQALIKILRLHIGYDFPIPTNDKDNGYIFNNGSSISVSTGYRGGTLQSLHISEFGKICKKYPEKAKEIVTGAFNSVGKDGTKTIESTAEGKTGYFYDYCQEAEKRQLAGKEPVSLEFKFHFFPWWKDSQYFNDEAVEIPERLQIYFEKLRIDDGVNLTDGQKRWYTLIEKTQGDNMKREYPSTPKESFEQAIDGAYYAKQFREIYASGRIGKLPENPHIPVMTFWDLGVSDSMAIWFIRKLSDTCYQVIDYYENSGEGLRHYFKVLKDKGYNYGKHYAPHDIKNRSLTGDAKSRLDIAREGYEIDGEVYSVKFEVVESISIMDGIEQTREILKYCEFDEVKCGDGGEKREYNGISHLETYRKEWDDKRGCWKDKPLHDKSSHGADAFRMFGVAMNKPKPIGMIDIPIFGRTA